MTVTDFDADEAVQPLKRSARRGYSTGDKVLAGTGVMLAAMAALTSTVDDPLPQMVSQVRAALGAAGAAVRSRRDDADAWGVIVSDGVCDDGEPTIAAPIDERTELALYGEGFGAADSSVLTAFSSQITTVLDQERLPKILPGAERAVRHRLRIGPAYGAVSTSIPGAQSQDRFR